MTTTCERRLARMGRRTPWARFGLVACWGFLLLGVLPSASGADICYGPSAGYPQPLGIYAVQSGQFFTADPLPSLTTLQHYCYGSFMMHEAPGGDTSKQTLHNGVDFYAPAGTPVQPPFNATVSEVLVVGIWNNSEDNLPTIALANPYSAEYLVVCHLDTTGTGIHVSGGVHRRSHDTSDLGYVNIDHVHFGLCHSSVANKLPLQERVNPLKYAFDGTDYGPSGDTEPPEIHDVNASQCTSSEHDFFFHVDDKMTSTGYVVGPYTVELEYDGTVVDWSTFDQYVSKFSSAAIPAVYTNFYASNSTPLGAATSTSNPNVFCLTYCPPASSSVECNPSPCWEIRASDLAGHTDSWFRDESCDGNTTEAVRDLAGEMDSDTVMLTWKTNAFHGRGGYRVESVDNGRATDITDMGLVTVESVGTTERVVYEFRWSASIAGTGLGPGTYRVVYRASDSTMQQREIQIVEGRSSLPFALLVGRNPAVGEVELRLTGAPGVEVEVRAFDVQGRLVRDFGALRLDRDGRLKIYWDGKSDGASRVPAGLYFVEARCVTGRTYTRVLFVRSR